MRVIIFQYPNGNKDVFPMDAFANMKKTETRIYFIMNYPKGESRSFVVNLSDEETAEKKYEDYLGEIVVYDSNIVVINVDD
jgi:hypothetical protein